MAKDNSTHPPFRIQFQIPSSLLYCLAGGLSREVTFPLTSLGRGGLAGDLRAFVLLSAQHNGLFSVHVACGGDDNQVFGHLTNTVVLQLHRLQEEEDGREGGRPEAG